MRAVLVAAALDGAEGEHGAGALQRLGHAPVRLERALEGALGGRQVAAGGELIRRARGTTAFGINAFTADAAGDPLVEIHDETSSGAGRHEELYVVLSGRATFIVNGDKLDAPTGSLLLVEPGTERGAVAAAADTTVLVVGGRPGAAAPVSPFEHWYAAEPAYQAGDYAQATAIASESLHD